MTLCNGCSSPLAKAQLPHAWLESGSGLALSLDYDGVTGHMLFETTFVCGKKWPGQETEWSAHSSDRDRGDREGLCGTGSESTLWLGENRQWPQEGWRETPDFCCSLAPHTGSSCSVARDPAPPEVPSTWG